MHGILRDCSRLCEDIWSCDWYGRHQDKISNSEHMFSVPNIPISFPSLQVSVPFHSCDRRITLVSLYHYLLQKLFNSCLFLSGAQTLDELDL